MSLICRMFGHRFYSKPHGYKPRSSPFCTRCGFVPMVPAPAEREETT